MGTSNNRLKTGTLALQKNKGKGKYHTTIGSGRREGTEPGWEDFYFVEF